jgi:hypothetical protein
MKRYTIEVNEHQLRLIAQCVEDLNRFYSGQMGLSNTANILDTKRKVMLQDELDELKAIVNPNIHDGYGYYGWSGAECRYEIQRKFLAESYYLYREIYHQLANPDDTWNVYNSETLRCADSGEPIIVKEVK